MEIGDANVPGMSTTVDIINSTKIAERAPAINDLYNCGELDFMVGSVRLRLLN